MKRFLREHLTKEQKNRWPKEKYGNIDPDRRAATDHFFGVGNDVIETPLSNTDEYAAKTEKNDVHRQIEAHLGFPIAHKDYVDGYVTDKHQRRESLSAILANSNPSLKNKYELDPDRKKSNRGYTARIVRGHEVLGQTNPEDMDNGNAGHAWTGSCKNVRGGVAWNSGRVFNEVKAGTSVVFIKDPDGREIYRGTLQPYVSNKNPKHIAFALNGEYYKGSAPNPDHTAFAKKTAIELSHPEEDFSAKYNLDLTTKASVIPDSIRDHQSGVYNDRGTSTIDPQRFADDAAKKYIEDHRTSGKYIPMNVVGKLVASNINNEDVKTIFSPKHPPTSGSITDLANHIQNIETTFKKLNNSLDSDSLYALGKHAAWALAGHSRQSYDSEKIKTDIVNNITKHPNFKKENFSGILPNEINPKWAINSVGSSHLFDNEYIKRYVLDTKEPLGNEEADNLLKNPNFTAEHLKTLISKPNKIANRDIHPFADAPFKLDENTLKKMMWNDTSTLYIMATRNDVPRHMLNENLPSHYNISHDSISSKVGSRREGNAEISGYERTMKKLENRKGTDWDQKTKEHWLHDFGRIKMLSYMNTGDFMTNLSKFDANRETISDENIAKVLASKNITEKNVHTLASGGADNIFARKIYDMSPVLKDRTGYFKKMIDSTPVINNSHLEHFLNHAAHPLNEEMLSHLVDEKHNHSGDITRSVRDTLAEKISNTNNNILMHKYVSHNKEPFNILKTAQYEKIVKNPAFIVDGNSMSMAIAKKKPFLLKMMIEKSPHAFTQSHVSQIADLPATEIYKMKDKLENNDFLSLDLRDKISNLKTD